MKIGTIINCKRNSYAIQYQNFDEQKNIGDKIRCIRLKAGLTIDSLAEKINIDRTTLIRYERNKITEEQIKTNILLAIEDACEAKRYCLFNDYLLFYETNQLKLLRKKFNLTQEAVAKDLKVTKKTFGYWERKKCRPSRLVWQSTVDYFTKLTSELEASLGLAEK